jgi:C_GCAxxG_C_C family probable redox protein
VDMTPKPAGEAVDLFMQGYNCCQAVFAAYCGRFGMAREDGLRLTAGMGGGMGGMRDKCGAVTAMFLLAGLRDGTYAASDGEAKKRMYALVQELDKAFADRAASANCRELLQLAEGKFSGLPALTAAFDDKKPCATLVDAASRIVSERLFATAPDGRS